MSALAGAYRTLRQRTGQLVQKAEEAIEFVEEEAPRVVKTVGVGGEELFGVAVAGIGEIVSDAKVLSDYEKKQEEIQQAITVQEKKEYQERIDAMKKNIASKDIINKKMYHQTIFEGAKKKLTIFDEKPQLPPSNEDKSAPGQNNQNAQGAHSVSQPKIDNGTPTAPPNNGAPMGAQPVTPYPTTAAGKQKSTKVQNSTSTKGEFSRFIEDNKVPLLIAAGLVVLVIASKKK